ncbi:MAG: hypothetical protein Q7T89_04960 [Anaerolineales bacterium]|nr:hypothetical protein [Anaerolineales bacterium]
MIFLCLLLARRTMDKTVHRFSFDCCNTHRPEALIPFRIGDTNRTMMKFLICNSGKPPAK